jgi:predicted TIM-barrel fold metal-dependent hydrolase
LQVIADHQGGMKGTSQLPANMSVTAQPGYASLVSLAKAGKVWIKVSALYRASSLKAGYGDVEPLIKALAKEVPQQLIWASDWPHTSGLNRTEANRYVQEGFRDVDDGAIIENIKKWVGEELWRRMTVETPAKVYQ